MLNEWLMQPVDLYCERRGDGWFGEPLNTVSNLSFFVAAAAAILRSRRGSDGARSMRSTQTWMIGLAFAIGAGSVAFHMAARRWAQVLDVGPIFLFELSFLAIFARRFVRLSSAATCVITIGFAAVNLGTLPFAEALHGSFIYLPTWVALVVLTGVPWPRISSPVRASLFVLLTAFTVSLMFRTLDRSLCGVIPVGTHFLWHLGNGLVIDRAMRTLTMSPEPIGK